PVVSTNCLASSGVVSTPVPAGAFSRISEEAPIHPISPSTRMAGLIDFIASTASFVCAAFFFDRQRGTVEDYFVEPGCRRFFRFCQRMSVIGVEKNLLAKFFSYAFHQRRGLANADECAFAFGRSDHDRQIQCAGRGGNRIKGREIRKIKM